MDKSTFKVNDDYKKMLTTLYFKLTEQLNIDSKIADELFNDFDRYNDELLQLGKFTDASRELNKNTILKDAYEDIPKYTKLLVIYEYENGMSLTESSGGTMHLVPTDLLQIK